MEQNKINVIIIAGIIVAGAGAWSGPIMTAQTANEFLDDLSEVQTAQVGFYEDQGFNFDEFGLGGLKDEIFFFDHDDQFALDIEFGGPIIDMIAFEQELVPDNTVGIQLPTVGANTFGAPVTIVEMQDCTTADAAHPSASGSLLLDECEPALIDTIFLMTPSTNADANAKFRVQVAVCEGFNAVDNQFFGADGDPATADADNVSIDDLCSSANPNEFDNAIIVFDAILQPYPDHTETIIVDAGAIPPIAGSLLMARAADSTANTNEIFIWVGLERVGGAGAFEFVNPALFGGDFVDGCVAFQIEDATVAKQDVGIFVEVFGIPFFGITDVNGQVTFQNVPLGVFAIIDIELTNSVIFLDQVFSDTLIDNELGFTGGATGCFEIDFDIQDAPSF